MKGFISCSSFSQSFYFFVLKGEAKPPPPQIDARTKKNSQTPPRKFVVNYPLTSTAPGHLILQGASTPRNAWATTLPAGWARQDRNPIVFPWKTQKCFASKSFRELAVSRWCNDCTHSCR